MFIIVKKRVRTDSNHIFFYSNGRNRVLRLGKLIREKFRKKLILVEYDIEQKAFRLTPTMGKYGRKISQNQVSLNTVNMPLGKYLPVGNNIYELDSLK